MKILFICPHGAAKSVIATAIARDLAERHRIGFESSNAGTNPDGVLNPIAVDALRARGIEFDEAPRMVTKSDIRTADVVVSFGCGRDDLPATPAAFIDWSDVPDASADVNGLYSILTDRIRGLFDGVSFMEIRVDKEL